MMNAQTILTQDSPRECMQPSQCAVQWWDIYTKKDKESYVPFVEDHPREHVGGGV